MEVISFLAKDIHEGSWYLWTDRGVDIASILVYNIEKYAYFREQLRFIVPLKILIKSWLGFNDDSSDDNGYELSETTKRFLTLAASDVDVNTEKEVHRKFAELLRRLLTPFNRPVPEPPFLEAYTISYLASVAQISFDHTQLILMTVRKVIVLKEKYRKWYSAELFAQVDSTRSLAQYETKCFEEYFGHHSNITFYIRLSFLCAFSLGRILQKYGSIENWTAVEDIASCLDRLKEPLVLLFLCTYREDSPI